MVKLLPVKRRDNKFMEQIGFSWHTDPDNTPYIANEIVQITPKEADAYYEAVNELYDMFVGAGEHIIKIICSMRLEFPFYSNLDCLVKIGRFGEGNWIGSHLGHSYYWVGILDLRQGVG